MTWGTGIHVPPQTAVYQMGRPHARGNGIEPVEHVVGFDALAVFLHKDNPISQLSLAQLYG